MLLSPDSPLARRALRPPLLPILLVLLVVGITIQHILKGTINNYYIFVRPFYNLLADRNLYLEYPQYYYDTYKYSPPFALLVGWLTLLPDWLGLLIWNAVGAAVLFGAVVRLFPDQRRGYLLFWLILLDFITSLHNSQSNALLTGLMLWTYVSLERGQMRWAGLCVALAFFIKIYGIGIGLIFLFYPGWWRGALWAILFGTLLALSPLILVSWPAFLVIYQGWFDIVRASATGIQLSVMGGLETWFGLVPPKGVVQGLGLLLLLLPLLHLRFRTDFAYRRLYVSAILIFVVIFNQMAESPTFLIPVTGFMLWWLWYGRSTRLALPLLVVVFVFTCLAATDLYPAFVRNGFFIPYRIKVAPMILAWMLIMAQLLLYPRWRARLLASEAEAAKPLDAAPAA